jgi:hypothetical protein
MFIHSLYVYYLSSEVGLNPLPHGGRPFWPSTSLHANSSKSAEGKVSSKIRYSSSWILGLKGKKVSKLYIYSIQLIISEYEKN